MQLVWYAGRVKQVRMYGYYDMHKELLRVGVSVWFQGLHRILTCALGLSACVVLLNVSMSCHVIMSRTSDVKERLCMQLI
jgi:hypothetical protein